MKKLQIIRIDSGGFHNAYCGFFYGINQNMIIMDKKKMIKVAKAGYMREWRKKNPEKVREHMDNYWLRKFEREHANE